MRAHGAATPEPALLPLSTSQTSLPAVTSSQVLWLMWAGAEATEEAGGGSLRRRPAPTRRAAMLRATRPGGGRRTDLSSCSGAQAGCPLRGRAQASYAAAGQPQGSSGRHSSGGVVTGYKTPITMVITIVMCIAVVRQGV